MDTQYTLSLLPKVQLIESKSEVLLVNTENEEVYGIDQVGAEAIRLTLEGKTIGSTIEELSKNYNVNKDILQQDVLRVVDELCDLGLIVLHSPKKPDSPV